MPISATRLIHGIIKIMKAKRHGDLRWKIWNARLDITWSSWIIFLTHILMNKTKTTTHKAWNVLHATITWKMFSRRNKWPASAANAKSATVMFVLSTNTSSKKVWKLKFMTPMRLVYEKSRKKSSLYQIKFSILLMS